MKYEIFGDNLQILKIDMAPHDGIFAEAGAMVNMSGSILMESQLKGGIISGLKHVLTGERI